MPEILILKKYEDSKEPAVFAVWDRKVGWFQHDYAQALVGDITTATAILVSEDGTREMACYVTGPDQDGPFHVVVTQ